jgi:beta-lactamase class C
VQTTLDDWKLPGAAITIVKDTDIVFMKGYGMRKVGQPEPIDIHTVFRIASVSKTFASVLTGLLVEEDLLDWKDRIVEHIPDFCLKDTAATRQLTINHLLSHTSGLMPHAYDNLIEAEIPYKTIIQELKNIPVVGTPGNHYGYQNVFYSLIGDIVEKITWIPYEELIAQRLFYPLGMEDASLGWDAYMAETNRASPHISRYYRWIPVHDKKAYYSVLPSAGVNASISDMAQWLRAMMGGRSDVIPSKILQMVHARRIRTPGERRRYHWNGRVSNTYYGMGWRIFDYTGHTMITHSGSVEGYLAQMAFIPDLSIGIVVLMNSRRTDTLVPTFFDMYLDLNSMNVESK